MSTTTIRLTAESKVFIAFILSYLGTKWVESLNSRTDISRCIYVCSEVVRLAHNGDYIEIGRHFEMPAYYLGWVLETGRVNGMTHMAVRQMDVKSILALIATIAQMGLQGDAVASYLMSRNLHPVR